jgi:RimJ/RimL family protein N-acetyltransferase
MTELPLGEPVANTAPADRPRRQSYTGRYVELHPVEPEADVAELYKNAHGDEAANRIWTYLGYGPFQEPGAMLAWLKSCQASTDPLFLTVMAKELKERVGVVSFLNIVPAMRTVELGHIWYSPLVQRTRVNTEVIYLMLGEAFDALNYRRVEWKCNALNAHSRAAALRLGFSFEGIFKQHMIVKGRNRDTAWFALLDRDWPIVKHNMETWLSAEAGSVSLRQLNRPLLRATGEGM